LIDRRICDHIINSSGPTSGDALCIPTRCSIEIQLYDAFSTRLFRGNVAGVVYADERLDEKAMQEIAA
jgi:hypothetical protein